MKQPDIAILGIDYDEPEQGSYRAVTIDVRSDARSEVVHHRFATGDPGKDWASAIKFLAEIRPLRTSYSSSVDHFTMDGDEWGWSEDEMLIRLENSM